MKKIQLKDVKKGYYFRLVDDDSAPRLVKYDYVFFKFRYRVFYPASDIMRTYLIKGSTYVYVDFEF